jgi:hypothetical protein
LVGEADKYANFVCLFWFVFFSFFDIGRFRRRMLRIRCTGDCNCQKSRDLLLVLVFFWLCFFVGGVGTTMFCRQKVAKFCFSFFMGWGVWNSTSFRLLVLQTWSQAEEEMVTERAR